MDPDDDEIHHAWKGSDIVDLDLGPVGMDMANNTHDSNDTLRKHTDIQGFLIKFNTVNEMDEDTCQWLGDIPYVLRNIAIPLFEDETGVHYQIHPCYLNYL